MLEFEVVFISAFCFDVLSMQCSGRSLEDFFLCFDFFFEVCRKFLLNKTVDYLMLLFCNQRSAQKLKFNTF